MLAVLQEQAFGGGLYLDLSVVPTHLVMGSVNFVQSGGKAKYGITGFIKVPNLLTFFDHRVSKQTRINNELVGLDDAGIFTIVPVDLYSLFQDYTSGNLHVLITNPRDAFWCGPVAYPCQTLAYTLTKVKTGSKIILEANQPFDAPTGVTLTSVTIETTVD